MPTTRSRARGVEAPVSPAAAPSAKRRAKASAGGSRDAKRRTIGAGAKKAPKAPPRQKQERPAGASDLLKAARSLLTPLSVTSAPAPLLSDADVPERGRPSAAHVRGPSIMRGHFNKKLNVNPAHRRSSDAALLRAVPAQIRPKPASVGGGAVQAGSIPAPLRAAVLEACMGAAIRAAFADVRMINNSNTHARFDPVADAERHLRTEDGRARAKKAAAIAVAAERALAEACGGDEEAYRAEAASCLPTPEQEAVAAKIVERCAEYDRGVRCTPPG